MKKGQPITSIKVNPETWKEAKIEAAKQDMPLYEVVDEALRQWLKAKRHDE